MNLQKHLDRMPVGYPATESGVELRILEQLFTPEEAEVAVQLSMVGEPIGRIYKRINKKVKSQDELQKILERMEHKGTLLESNVKGKTFYKNAPFAIGTWEFQVDRLTPSLINDFEEYIRKEFGQELAGTGIPQLRTVPVGKSIPLPDKYPVSDYDIIRNIIENNNGQMAVANCICRQANDLIGKPCSVTDLRQTCLMVAPDAAQHYINLGIAEAVSKEKILEILDKAQENGLVIQPTNSKRAEAVCCCCGDCCGILKNAKKYPRPADLYASNFYAEADINLCSGCGTCVDRCQLNAATLVNGIISINLDRCIGCGNCVVVCPSEAVRLKKKEKEIIPPKNMTAMEITILSKKVGLIGMLKIAVAMFMKKKI